MRGGGARTRLLTFAAGFADTVAFDTLCKLYEVLQGTGSADKRRKVIGAFFDKWKGAKVGARQRDE